MMGVSQNLRQHPPDHFPSSSHHHNFQSLPLRTAQLNSQRLASAASSADFDPSLYSSSPASTLASSPATVNLDYPTAESYGEYYMPQSQPLQGRNSAASHRSLSTRDVSAASADSTPAFAAPSWSASSDSGSHLAPQYHPYAPHQRSRFPSGTFHRRNNSDSSVPTPAPSPFAPHAAYPHIVDTDLPAHFPSPANLDFDQYAYGAKSLPPSATSTGFTETFYDFSSPAAHDAFDFQLYQRAMTDAMVQGSSPEQAPPASSSGDLPRLPIGLPSQQSTQGEYEDTGRSQLERGRIPKLDRTVSDAYQDALYNPSLVTASGAGLSQPLPATALPASGGLRSPQHDVCSERIQAARHDHMAARRSPAAASPRQRSPYQPASQAFDVAAVPAYAAPGSAKTVSPQEVSREYEGPDAGDHAAAAAFFPSVGFRDSAAPAVDPETARAAQVLQQYPFAARRRPAPAADAPPEFHASLTSMESTRSEPDVAPATASSAARATPSSAASHASRSPTHRKAHGGRSSASATASPASSGTSRGGSAHDPTTPATPIPRPASTASDAGTYTCTYHGCPQRFETPALLQRHKREAHRQPTPGSAGGAGAGSGAGSNHGGSGGAEAEAGAAADSQAGPHRCDRINPATGRPCRSIFSRPYDLTRHEDTIHNARRTKARCPLCAEDKTFSRSDALTRHMRVVHPDVDFPGKQRRKG